MASPRKRRNVENLDALKAFIAERNRQMVDYRKLTNPPYRNVFTQETNVMEMFRLQQNEMSQAWRASAWASVTHLTHISKSSQHLYEIFAQTNVALDCMQLVHNSWLERISDMNAYRNQLNTISKLTLCNCSIQLAATESILAGLEFNFLKRQYDFPFSTVSAIQRSLFDTTASHRSLAESFSDLSAVVQMPAFVLPGATYDLYTAGYALKALDPLEQPEDEEVEEEISIISAEYVGNLDFVALLELVNPQLVRLYEGASEALDGNNPDRIRHFLASLRDLWNHLVREIAPKEETLDWISEYGIEGDLDCNNRPTRRGRIRFISRNINSAPLVDFINHSAKMSTILHETYNRVHQLEPGLTDWHLSAILYRTEAELSYLIRIWLTTARQ